MNSVSQRIHRHNISYDDIEGIGIGVPSPVTANGIARESVNLGWHEYDVTFEMQQRTGLPVKIGNDVNVAALGVLWKGSVVGCSNAIVITLGTGIGGGIVVSSQIVDGYDGSAGEAGHLIVNPNENEICACGRKGCLEQYASATGIVRMTRRVLESSQKPSSRREIKNSLRNFLNLLM